MNKRTILKNLRNFYKKQQERVERSHLKTVYHHGCWTITMSRYFVSKLKPVTICIQPYTGHEATKEIIECTGVDKEGRLLLRRPTT